MLTFLKMNKSLVTYSLILLLVLPFFGITFLINIVGNILLLVFLISLLVFLIALISLNSIKSKIITCQECGTISLGGSNTCMNCGANLFDKNTEGFENLKKPGETTIEIKAEEIK